MINLLGYIPRYVSGVRRQLRNRYARKAYLSSPKPIEGSDQLIVTLFFDYEGKWAHPDQQGNSCKGVKRVLDILDDTDMLATFNVVGLLAQEESEIIMRIAETNHEIASHTMEHEVVESFSAGKMKRDIELFRRVVNYLNVSVTGFRGPRSRWTPQSLKGLLSANVLWNAEDDTADSPYIIVNNSTRRLWRMPVTIDDWQFESQALSPTDMFGLWRDALQEAADKKRYIAFGFHPWILAKEPGRLEVFQRLVELLNEMDKVVVTTFGRLANQCEELTRKQG